MDKQCERITKMLPDIAAGNAKISAEVQAHLDGCPDCAREFYALRQTVELLNEVPMEPAPDLWEAIRPNLMPRESQTGAMRLRWWFGKHRLQSAVAGVAAAVAIASLMLTGHQTPPEADTQAYFSTHVSMSWREPFADKAALGMTGIPAAAESEDIR